MIGPICPDCRDEFDDDASLTTHLDYWSSRALTYAPGSGPLDDDDDDIDDD